jgi:Ca-activated chloride channel family protein
LVTLSADKAAIAGSGGEAKVKRLPVNINVVLDRSSSMAGQPLEQVKQAAKFLVEQVGADDFMSVTVFDHYVDTVFPAQRVVNKDLLKAAIHSIEEGWSTNLSGGLLRGYEEALKECRQGQVNRVLLLTDGMANVGITDPATLSAKARALLEKNVSLSTIGVGLHFNEDLLIALADAGNGSYYYVKSAEQIPNVFAAELKGLLSVVAQGIALKVDGLSGCRVTMVYGYEPSFTDNGASLSLPDMFRDEEKRLVVELSYPALPGGEHPLLRLSLSYADACRTLAHTSLEITAKLVATADVSEPHEPDFEVIKVVELTRTATAKDRIAEAMDRGDYSQAQNIVEERLSVLESLAQAERADDEALHEEIATLRQLDMGRLKDADDSLVAETRKDLRSQSYQVMRGQSNYRSPKQAGD